MHKNCCSDGAHEPPPEAGRTQASCSPWHPGRRWALRTSFAKVGGGFTAVADKDIQRLNRIIKPKYCFFIVTNPLSLPTVPLLRPSGTSSSGGGSCGYSPQHIFTTLNRNSAFDTAPFLFIRQAQCIIFSKLNRQPYRSGCKPVFLYKEKSYITDLSSDMCFHIIRLCAKGRRYAMID